MSAEFEEPCAQAAGDVEMLSKNEHDDLHKNVDSTQVDDKLVGEPEVVEESVSPVQEEEVRSRHSSTSSVSNATEPFEEHNQEPEPIVEPKKYEPVVHSGDENQHIKENDVDDDKPKNIRPLVQPDFTQAQQPAKKEVDENDWAIKNQNSGKIKNLISMFDKGTVLNEKLANSTSEYKSAYGVSQGTGKKIRQDVFH